MKDLRPDALKVVRKFYEEYNAFTLGMDERGIKQPEDVYEANLYLISYERSGWLDTIDLGTDRFSKTLRGTLAISLYIRMEYAQMIEFYLSGPDIVRHAQRVLTAWALECWSFNHPVFLPDLLTFDSAYLYCSGFVGLLNKCVSGRPELLAKRDRAGFASRIADLFAAVPGRERKGPSKEVLAAHYWAILGELERGIILESDVGTPVSIEETNLYGWYLYQLRDCERVEIPHYETQATQDRYRQLYNRYIIASNKNAAELHGLRKVLAIHFPLVTLSGRDGFLFIHKNAINDTTCRKGSYCRLAKELGAISRAYSNARERCREGIIIGGLADRQQKKALEHIAKALLLIMHQYEMDVLNKYLRTKISTSALTVCDFDPYRDWALIEELMPKKAGDPPFPGCSLPAEALAETPQASSCEVDRGGLIRLVQARPKDVTALGPSMRSKRAAKKPARAHEKESIERRRARKKGGPFSL